MLSMLIDTSGFFAFYSKKDENHRRAVECYRRAPLRLTTNYVLAEYVALALIRGQSRREVLTFSEEILSEETVTLVWIDEALHTRAVELSQTRPDKTYSLCDAVSFVLMRERGSSEALTTDKHSVQEGFVRLLEA